MTTDAASAYIEVSRSLRMHPSRSKCIARADGGEAYRKPAACSWQVYRHEAGAWVAVGEPTTAQAATRIMNALDVADPEREALDEALRTARRAVTRHTVAALEAFVGIPALDSPNRAHRVFTRSPDGAGMWRVYKDAAPKPWVETWANVGDVKLWFRPDGSAFCVGVDLNAPFVERRASVSVRIDIAGGPSMDAAESTAVRKALASGFASKLQVSVTEDDLESYRASSEWALRAAEQLSALARELEPLVDAADAAADDLAALHRARRASAEDLDPHFGPNGTETLRYARWNAASGPVLDMKTQGVTP